MYKKIIITGATGMIGSAIIRRALQEEFEITCIVRQSSEQIGRIPQSKNIKIVECDMDNYHSLELSGNYDWFFHLAWDKTVGLSRDDVYVQLRNVQHTLDAVRLAERCGCEVFIGAGSQAEYGIKDVPLTSSMSVSPESGYGIAKYTANRMCSLLCKQLGMRFIWFRILSVYGPDDRANSLISYVINSIRQGTSPKLTKCEQIWDYLFSDDVADAFILAAKSGVTNKTYPLGSGVGWQLKKYIEIIRDSIDTSVEIKFGEKEYYPHQPMVLVADISDLVWDIGWNPKVKFEEGIQEIL